MRLFEWVVPQHTRYTVAHAAGSVTHISTEYNAGSTTHLLIQFTTRVVAKRVDYRDQ